MVGVPGSKTVAAAAEAFLDGIRAGIILTRSGDPYKPSTIRAYEQALRAYILPHLGKVRLGDLAPNDVQDVVERMLAEDLNPSTVRNALLPLRRICARAKRRGEIVANPTTGTELPAVRGVRERFPAPEEIGPLLHATCDEDRAVWATAFFGGLRLGELLALLVEDIDLAAGVIHVRRNWDQYEGPQTTKSRSGIRAVPIVASLRPHLETMVLRRRRGLAFGRELDVPFSPSTLQDRADRAWAQAGLLRVTPHECRHGFAALAIASGVNLKALQTFLGHATIGVTLDVYGHLLPGAESEAAGLIDGYLTTRLASAHEAAGRPKNGRVATAGAGGVPTAIQTETEVSR